MNNFIKSYEEWQIIYKKNRYNIWFIILLSNGEKLYLREYKEWLLLKPYCEENHLNIDNVQLRYRSHTVNIPTKEAEAVYLVKSILGSLNSKNIDTITSGLLKNGKVTKTIWTTPELIEHLREEDILENCFESALIYNNGSKK